MAVYHITMSNTVEECQDYFNCTVNERLHFDSLHCALKNLDERIDKSLLKGNLKVKRYEGEINYNSGYTKHYEGNRTFREMELIRILGKGEKVKAFAVDEGNNGMQIQEVLSNGILNVYSFYTHRKITLFALHPERIITLYTAIGEFPPEWLIKKSEFNVRKGYNKIFI